MRLSFLLSTAMLAALAITAASAQTSVDQAMTERQNVAALELPATGSNLPLVAWSAVMFILVGAGATMLYRWLGK